jgi:sodium/bile acid cotransporter 7
LVGLLLNQQSEAGVKNVKQTMNQLRKNWFLISLLVLLAIGFESASSFESLSNIEWLKWTVVSVTMFLMAWPLEFGKLKSAFASPLAPLMATALNLIAIPLLVWPLAKLVGAELGPGMIIAAATPSTLASAAVFTRRAGGDDSIAMMVTILTNASCFLVMPFWVMVQTGNSIDSSALVGTIYKLLCFVVIPIGLAQLARINTPSAQWATKHKPKLSFAALIGILSMVFLGAVKMGLRFEGDGPSNLGAGNLALTALFLLLVHVAVFWTGIWLSSRSGLARESQIAVGFSGSQKTLMIGLSTAINLGFSIVPIVLYHTIQLIVDSIFAERFRSKLLRNQSPEPTEVENSP